MILLLIAAAHEDMISKVSTEREFSNFGSSASSEGPGGGRVRGFALLSCLSVARCSP